MTRVKREAVLITGAGQRIGAVIARNLAEVGYCVCVHHNRSRDEAEQVCRAIEMNGGRALPVHADLADESQTEALIDQCASKLGAVTALVNNASLFEPDTIETVSHDSWHQHMAVNLRAPQVLSQRFAAQLPADSQGAIVNIIDQRVWNLPPDFLSYTISKSALWTLTKTLALALAPRVRVNAVGPGPTIANQRQSDAHFMQQWQHTPLRRQIQPQDVAMTTRFLLSSPAITGQMICPDGGEHLGYAQPALGFVPKE